MCAGRSSRLASAGLSESALNVEMTTDTAIVSANGAYMRPVSPPMNATGTNTATMIADVPMIGPVTSRMACSVASRAPLPRSMCDITASTTTMASSTTMPIASTRPNIVSVLIVKPSAGKKMNVPIRETGMATSGIRVARAFCRKTNTTSTTSRIASNRVWTISSIEADTAGVES